MQSSFMEAQKKLGITRGKFADHLERNHDGFIVQGPEAASLKNKDIESVTNTLESVQLAQVKVTGKGIFDDCVQFFSVGCYDV